MDKLYPDSAVEVHGFEAKHYDFLMNLITFGRYNRFIKDVIAAMEIRKSDKILDFGAGGGKNACLMHDYLDKNGKILGLDIGDEMIAQFVKKCSHYSNVDIKKQRIDEELDVETDFDKVLISFVLHGLPQESRLRVIANVFKHLKKGGEFFILDYNEMKVADIPFYLRIPFKKIECPYAFDYMENYNWKNLMKNAGFLSFDEKFYFKNIVRLLVAQK